MATSAAKGAEDLPPEAAPLADPVERAAVEDPAPLLGVGPARAELPALQPAAVRWLAIGGGMTPEYNQVSIEQDLLLAQEVFGTGGVVLFAGGGGSHGVQVEDPTPRGDPLMHRLAELFAPRGGRGASYRPTRLPAVASASLENALAAVRAATSEPGPPLLLYLAGHGERGESARLGGLALWGQETLRAEQLAAALDAARRPVQVIATSCFSGSFGELAFARADPGAGAPAGPRCGLFAATAEREASGCDPNPDRAAQESFALHFLHALRGEDRDGAALPPGELDLDGDGAVSLLEAHARARIAGGGIDVPTTTSERWLRAHAPARGRAAAVALPEEDAVVARLAASLELTGREGEVARRLESVLLDMSSAYDRLDRASAAADAAYRVAAAELLARFPVLDDPWHPDFAATFAAHRAEISALVEGGPAFASYRAAQDELGAAQDAVSELLVRSARLERLARALENRALAGRLRARGGAAWRTYAGLLACERGRPMQPPG